MSDSDTRLVTRDDLDRGLNDVRREFESWKREVYDRCYQELNDKVDQLARDFRASAEALQRIELQGVVVAKSAANAAESAEHVRTNRYTKFALAVAASSPIVALVLHFLPVVTK